MTSTRLPGKPLLDIGGAPMIVQVWRRAVEAAIGEVAIACEDRAIAEAVDAVGGRAVMTRADHASGSDRIREALSILDPGENIDIVVNLQGDLPTLDPAVLRQCTELLSDPAVDIATLAAEIVDEAERTDPNVVKAVGSRISDNRMRALYFTRATAPWGEGPLYHHIGIYAYRRASLETFVGLPPSPLEQRERLEQLRALEAGMRIDVGLVDMVPIGVDTGPDLELARQWFADRRA